jgi:hypothetical protein
MSNGLNVRSSVGAIALLVAMSGAAADVTQATRDAQQQFQAQQPQAQTYVTNGLPTTVYGLAFGTGVSAKQTADAFCDAAWRHVRPATRRPH